MEEARAHAKLAGSEASRKAALDVEEQRRRTAAELGAQEKRWEIEKEQWQTRLVSKLHDRAEEAEGEMRERLVRERDTQIQMVIAKLNEEREEDAELARRELLGALAAERKRHAKEVGDLEDAARVWRDKASPQGSRGPRVLKRRVGRDRGCLTPKRHSPPRTGREPTR